MEIIPSYLLKILVVLTFWRETKDNKNKKKISLQTHGCYIIDLEYISQLEDEVSQLEDETRAK